MCLRYMSKFPLGSILWIGHDRDYRLHKYSAFALRQIVSQSGYPCLAHLQTIQVPNDLHPLQHLVGCQAYHFFYKSTGSQ